MKRTIGITHPLTDIADEKSKELILESWKHANCINGIHLFDEVLNSDDEHYLICDACGIEVHIKKVIIPDGIDVVIK